MTMTQSGSEGADGEATSDSSGRSPLARFRSRLMPAAGQAEATQVEEDSFQKPQYPVSPIKRAGRKKMMPGSGQTANPLLADRRHDLTHRLVLLARPLALKYQLNLERTFRIAEAQEWVRASEGALMRLPLRNTSSEAAGFYAELALALADERQKERGIMAEPALRWVEGASLLVDLRGEK